MSAEAEQRMVGGHDDGALGLDQVRKQSRKTCGVACRAALDRFFMRVKPPLCIDGDDPKLEAFGVSGNLPASHTDWVQSTLEAENIPVGTRSTLARQLAGYRQYLLDAAKREMRAEYRAKTHMRPAVKMVTRSPFG